MTDQRYARNDEIREGVDDAVRRRADQSEAGLADRERDDPAGVDTASGRAHRQTAVGGTGQGGAIDMELDKEPAEGRRDVSTDQ